MDDALFYKNCVHCLVYVGDFRVSVPISSNPLSANVKPTCRYQVP